MTFNAPSPPYVGPAKWHGGDNNKPIHRIVLHSTVSPCAEGGAREIAAYFRGATRPSSAHYIADPGEVVQLVFDSVVAYHAPPNENSLGIEMCDMPSTAAGAVDRWADRNHKRMLTRVVHLTADLCLAYAVPAVFLTVEDLLAGHHGITTHNNVSDAFHESDHWDPGAFPMDDFIRRVAARIEKLKAAAR